MVGKFEQYSEKGIIKFVSNKTVDNISVGQSVPF